jgi:hypothetical protein
MLDKKVLVIALIGYLLAGAPGLILGAVIMYFIGNGSND